MLFNSLGFALFLPLVFVLYWYGFKNSLRGQNIFLFLASYFFYACWDVRFLFLLAFSTFLDYYTGLRIDKAATKPNKKLWLIISVVVNLGFLAFFKYYNFFAESLQAMLAWGGLHVDIWTLQVVLPVGISFYTFHGMSYVFDIYHERQKPVTNYIDYSLFVSFFPLLVAGPIERAHHLLPQIQKPRTFNSKQAADGLRQMLWGFFKKVVVADSCAIAANNVFDHYGTLDGASLVLGAVLFAFQIYGDFSGYSDIALGTARLFGFDLLRNFSFPYFSRDIAEFWRRWHISLSSWFRDYLYIPLGGSKGGKWKSIRNTLIIFLVSGFWHGANWTFIVWGLIHALYFIPLLLIGRNRNNMNSVAENTWLPSLKELWQMAFTFALVTLAWIFFRAPDLHTAVEYITHMVSPSLFSKPKGIYTLQPFIFIAIMVILEWLQRRKQHALQFTHSQPVVLRWGMYYSVALLIFFFAQQPQKFIYFQF